MHPVDLPTVVTHVRDFETAELEANYTQAINLVMNGSFELNSKLKQFNDSINQKLERYLADNHNYLSLLITPENVTSNHLKSNQLPTLTSNILPATITKDESLVTIFPFEIDELSEVPLFSGATLKEKSITAMYTDVKIDGYTIKLIFDSGSADSIITRQLMD
ncbi:hypothetical protein G9A89_007828 [Geosiphon pyriformis]|nr:hypothetical protein G9A89_007828 [Geosiphon pyriformis]